MAAEGLANRLGQRLGSVDDEQAADLGVQTALDQVVEQRLHHSGVLGGALDHAERVLVARTVNADGGQQYSAIWMPSIWITSRSSCERSEAIHSFMRFDRQGNEAARGCRFGKASTVGGRNVAFREAHGAAELAGR